jgi:hypothetical protein
VRGKTKNAKRTLSISPEVFELLKKRRQSHPGDYVLVQSEMEKNIFPLVNALSTSS